MWEGNAVRWNKHYTSLHREEMQTGLGEEEGAKRGSFGEMEQHLALAGDDEGIVFELVAGRVRVRIKLRVSCMERLDMSEGVVLKEQHGHFRLVAKVVRPIPRGVRPGTYTFLYSPTHGCTRLPPEMFEEGDVPGHLLGTDDRNSK